MNEEILEPLLRKFRLAKVLKIVSANDRVLDVGCGRKATLVKELSAKVEKITGIDKAVESSMALPKNAQVIQFKFGPIWDLPDQSFTLVTMLAVLEHLDAQDAISTLKNIHRLLPAKGKLFLTVPTPRAKPVLEFLAFKLGIVSREQIEDHKIYYDKERLLTTLAENNFTVVEYKKFQLGMNSYCLAVKN